MWSLAGNQAVDQPIQQLCSWDLQAAAPALWLGTGLRSRGIQLLWVCEALKGLCAWRAQPAHPAALGLSLSGGRGRPGTESQGTRSEVLGLWVEQLISAPDALGGFRCWRPSVVSCVCPQFANPVRATGPQVSARAAYLALAVQGRRGKGRQGPRLLPRVL